MKEVATTIQTKITINSNRINIILQLQKKKSISYFLTFSSDYDDEDQDEFIENIPSKY